MTEMKKLKRGIARIIAMMVFFSTFALFPVNSYAAKASGVAGTCNWTIDTNGVLTIGPGQLYPEDAGEPWTWSEYRDEIKEVKTSGKIHVYDMNGMFSQCENLRSADLSGFDTSEADSMWAMFEGCTNLRIVNFSSFDTSEITSMGLLFNYCINLSNINLSNFNTENVEDMQFMFARTSITSLNLSNFDTSSVTNMSGLFCDCTELTNLNLSNFKTANVTDFSVMFDECNKLKKLDLSSFDTSAATDMGWMFGDEEVDLALDELKIGKWNTSKVEGSFYATFPKDMKNKSTGQKYTAGTRIPDISNVTYIAQVSGGSSGSNAGQTAAQREKLEWNGTLDKKIPVVKGAKFKAAKKKVTVSWKKASKKNLKKFDKVEVQVCPDKKFKKANTKRIEVKKTKKSATVKKLKKGKYYVRVRNVKGKGIKKHVSKWSKVKKVKVK